MIDSGTVQLADFSERGGEPMNADPIPQKSEALRLLEVIADQIAELVDDTEDSTEGSQARLRTVLSQILAIDQEWSDGLRDARLNLESYRDDELSDVAELVQREIQHLLNPKEEGGEADNGSEVFPGNDGIAIVDMPPPADAMSAFSRDVSRYTRITPERVSHEMRRVKAGHTAQDKLQRLGRALSEDNLEIAKRVVIILIDQDRKFSPLLTLLHKDMRPGAAQQRLHKELQMARLGGIMLATLELEDDSFIDAIEEAFGGDKNLLDIVKKMGKMIREPRHTQDKKVLNLVVQRAEILRALQGMEAAVSTLATANFRLVMFVAQNYRGRGVPFLDLIQEGNLALIRAIHKFRPEDGNQFSTYATASIKNRMTRALDNDARTIRISVRESNRIVQFTLAENELRKLFQRAPTIPELANFLDWEPVKVQEIIELRRRQNAISLATPVSFRDEDGESSLQDFIPDSKTVNPLTATVSGSISETLKRLFSEAGLEPSEIYILQMRFGFNNDKDHSLEETARKIGMSRETVRKLQVRALQKLRACCKKHNLEMKDLI